MTRGLLAGGLLALGLATGVASVALHAKGGGWLVLALLTPCVTAYAAAPGLARASYTVGWLAVLLVAVTGRPEGDYVIADTLPGYALLALGALLLALAIGTVPRRNRPHS